MYNYKKLKSILIKNFRNIGQVQLDFSESPIISLIGDNESGKTSCVKAVAVCALNAWTRDQKDYIRDGTSGFGVAIELEDGTIVARLKTATINNYTIKRPNGESWDTNKLDAGVPVQVQEIMGMIQEPETKEFLQVRTYEDQLLFVVTPSSTNYKVMYDALKVDQITRGIKIGSLQANALKSKIYENEISVKTLSNSIDKIVIYDIEPLKNIKNRLQAELSQIDRLEKAVALKKSIKIAEDRLGALKLIFDNKLEAINSVEVNRIVDISRLLNKSKELSNRLNILEAVSTIEQIDLTMISKLLSSVDRLRELKEKLNRVKIYEGLESIEGIDENIVSSMNKAIYLLDTIRAKQQEYEQQDVSQCSLISDTDILIINNLQKAIELKHSINLAKAKYEAIDTSGCTEIADSELRIIDKLQKTINMISNYRQLWQEYQAADYYVKQVSAYLKQMGVSFVTCQNCGESVIVDIDAITHSH